MSPHQILVVILRVCGIAWLLYFLGQSYVLFSYIPDGEGGNFYTARANPPLLAAYSLFQLLVGVSLIVFPSAISKRLLPEFLAERTGPTGTFKRWQSLGLTLIGVWSLAQAIPEVFYWLYVSSFAPEGQNLVSEYGVEQRARIVFTVVQLIIGFTLVLGARGLSGVLFSIKYSGRRH